MGTKVLNHDSAPGARDLFEGPVAENRVEAQRSLVLRTLQERGIEPVGCRLQIGERPARVLYDAALDSLRHFRPARFQEKCPAIVDHDGAAGATERSDGGAHAEPWLRQPLIAKRPTAMLPRALKEAMATLCEAGANKRD